MSTAAPRRKPAPALTYRARVRFVPLPAARLDQFAAGLRAFAAAERADRRQRAQAVQP
jgi:hypothetical protein